VKNVKTLIQALVLTMIISFSSQADIIIFKDGKKVKTSQSWEEGDHIKCDRFGGIVGYPKDTVEQIIKEETETEPVPQEKPVDSSEKNKNSVTDLQKQLSEKLPPKNRIEEAGNAAVTVKTVLGSGSGFFVHSDGYILTNRHVVEVDQKSIEKIEKYLEKEKVQLDNMKERIEKEKELKNRPPEITERLQKEFDDRQKEYYTLSSLRGEVYLRGIKISLADDTELSVSVVSLSDKYDLALLKLDGYKTPFIEYIKEKTPQGDSLYAIGSPLNLSRSVTSGICSGYRDGYIQTNIQLNPGNSGGPVVTKDGKVIGISTWKIVGVDIEGLSFAIPVETAIEEFKELKDLLK